MTNGGHTDSQGSSDDQNGQDNHDAKRVEGTVKDRKCRDITFLLIFVTFLGGMVCQNTLLAAITLKQRPYRECFTIRSYHKVKEYTF